VKRIHTTLCWLPEVQSVSMIVPGGWGLPLISLTSKEFT